MNHNPIRNPDLRRLQICVFCGSSHGAKPQYAAAAKKFGELIATNGHALVFGGGNVGLMGEVARAARDGGAPVTGILPEFLRHLEPPLETREDVLITPDFQSRKAIMLSMADAFVLLPGGLGTLDEYFEVLTSTQLHVLAKPIVLIDVENYYAPLHKLLERIVEQGFARPEILKLQHIVKTPEAAIETVNHLLVKQPQV